MHSTYHHRWTLAYALAIALAWLSSTGCQRQAYTDFYTESMAGEIRELEDRIYEYDAAYQSIEGELAVLQSENEALHQKLMTMQSTGIRGRSSLNPESNLSRDSEILSIPPATDSPSPPRIENKLPKEIPSADNLPSPSSSSKSQPTPAAKSPNAAPASPTTNPDSSSISDVRPPLIDPGTPSATLPSTLAPRDNSSAFTPPTSPSSTTSPPDVQSPSSSSGMTMPSNTLPSPLKPNSGLESIPMPGDVKPISPPQPSSLGSPSSSGPGMLVPPGLNQSSRLLPKRLDERSISDGKIELPNDIATASFTEPTRSPPVSSSVRSSDSKVVEVALHPTLCRGHNFDDDADDDGLYLVLQPRNQSGEIVDLPAAVTIVAVDPKKAEGDSRIARWTRSLEEVQQSHEPIGLSRGYHLALPWEDVEPTGNSVQVYVRYEMPDGRKLINEKTIQLRRVEAGNNVWTPRVAR